ncbi:MAG: periplasmic nitrate reductase, NapE protein [Gammaproteobacteria bacterium]|nr:periplasmic nitrate reductase, NapE protein [Gammaproteobacteria bacterium]
MIKSSVSKHDERITVLFCLVVLAPLIATLFVVGYGLVVWLLQLVMGPPGS